MRAFSIFAIPQAFSVADRLERRHMLARLGLAWLAMMQVMMFAFPGYLRSNNMSPDNLATLDHAIYLMNWISLVLTVPVVLYCAWPVWGGALRRMLRGRISMDVPVALGLAAAFIPSVHATWFDRGDVYFDSVTMFVAFLLTARYLELCARQSVGAGGPHQFIDQYSTVLSARANHIAFWFVVIQVGLAFAIGLAWFIHEPHRAIPVMVALLVISCPCALAMAVPTAVAAAHASLSGQSAQPEPDIYLLVQATGGVVRQNLYGSMAWHLFMIPLAAAGWVTPWMAAITMLLSSLAVSANSARLYRRRRHSAAPVWRPEKVEN